MRPLVDKMKRSAPLRRGKPLSRGRSRLGRHATPRRGAWRRAVLLETARLMPCAFCGKRPPVTAHHFPGKGHLGTTDDRLSCPACGDGVRGCHGAAQRYEIPAEAQIDAVGHTLHAHVLAGRVTLAEAREAVERVERLDWRERLRLALSQDRW